MFLPITHVLPSSLEVALVSRGVSPDDAKATVAEVERKLTEATEEVQQFPECVREVAEINPAAVLGGSPTGKDMFGEPNDPRPVPYRGLRTEVVLYKSTRYIRLDDHEPALGGWISRSDVGDDEVQYHLNAPHYEVLVHLYFKH